MSAKNTPDEVTNANTTPDEVTTTEQAKVPVYVQSSSAKDDPNVFIGVNGVNYVFPKDEEVMLPPEAAAEYHRAEKAKRIQHNSIKHLPHKFAR